MGIKFSEDIVPLSVLKVNPGKVVSHVAETHRPDIADKQGARDCGCAGAQRL